MFILAFVLLHVRAETGSLSPTDLSQFLFSFTGSTSSVVSVVRSNVAMSFGSGSEFLHHD